MTMRTDTRTSDDYEQLVVLRPDGHERKVSVFKHRTPLRQTWSLDAARDGLGSGQEVWVNPVDAAALRVWLRGVAGWQSRRLTIRAASAGNRARWVSSRMMARRVGIAFYIWSMHRP